MKKKILAIIAIMAICCTVLFTGCEFWDDASVLTFVEAPATTYYLGEDALDFTISVTKEGATNEYSYADFKSMMSISGFYTTAVGTRTATVSFEGGSIRFTYSVIDRDSIFAGGTGDEFDPYKISTAAQFQEMLNVNSLNGSYAYYKLINDIDLAGVTIVAPATTKNNVDATNGRYWQGTFDGANFTVKNINKVTNVRADNADGMDEKHHALFGYVGNATIKNVTFNFASEGADPCYAIVASGLDNTTTLTYENVTLTGYVDCANSPDSCIAPFTEQGGRQLATGKKLNNLVMKNCTNAMNYYNIQACYVAGLACTQKAITADTVWSFDNCKVTGRIEGGLTSVAGLVSVGWSNNTTAGLKISNCEFTGEIVTVAKYYDKVACSSSAVISGTYDVAKTGTISTLPALTATKTGKALAISCESDVDYYKVIYTTGRTRTSGVVDTDGKMKTSGGTLTYAEKVIATEGTTNYTLRTTRLYKATDAGNLTGLGNYYNSWIALADDGFVYVNTTEYTNAEGNHGEVVKLGALKSGKWELETTIVIFAYKNNQIVAGINVGEATDYAGDYQQVANYTQLYK